jgi:CheY-like chemotaxis protein
MKRVLIVDGEPQDLEDLKQTLAPLQGQWETAFAPDGEAALALLSATPFDALVSTVSDRGLDGASLLNKVREKFPTVVRIAPAGQKELDAAMRTIPVAHQFLANERSEQASRNGRARHQPLRSSQQQDARQRRRLDQGPSHHAAHLPEPPREDGRSGSLGKRCLRAGREGSGDLGKDSSTRELRIVRTAARNFPRPKRR